MTRRELINSVKAAAEPVYGEREAASIARLFAERRDEATPADLAQIAAARPIQYILGVADFYGLELAVGEGVLIPRPETEELVRWIIDDARATKNTNTEPTAPHFAAISAPAILDIGTGSGAIAIALAKSLPRARVTAIDISPDALKYARLNNGTTGAGAAIYQADALDPQLDPKRLAARPGSGRPVPNCPAPEQPASATWDIIVSNPPYVPAAERAQMADNVAKYEPQAALFVPDDDPLLYYRAIARLARRTLTPGGGALYFEIHENAAEAVTKLLTAEGFREVIVKEDINSKPRMVRCRP